MDLQNDILGRLCVISPVFRFIVTITINHTIRWVFMEAVLFLE
jgi:hypothetical protein